MQCFIFVIKEAKMNIELGSLKNKHKAFFLNNQPNALIIQIYSVLKLYTFRASSLPIIRSSHYIFGICKFHAGFYDRTQTESGWNCSSILTLFGSSYKNLHETYQCRMYSENS
jgi:hypothetical protein